MQVPTIIAAIIAAIGVITAAWINRPLSPISLPPQPPEIKPPISPVPSMYNSLRTFLANRDFVKADEETSRILLEITGNTDKGYNDLLSSSKIHCSVYQSIDRLWLEYSKDASGKSKFGFSLQMRIRHTVKNNEEFGERVGWRRNNYWITYNDLNNDVARNLGEAPEGYLPSRFRTSKDDDNLSAGWMLWSLLHDNSAGKCLAVPDA